MLDFDQDNSEVCKDFLKTKNGIDRLALYSSSVGRALIYPIYDEGEVLQAFCRRAAVKGCIYVLRMPITSLLMDKVKKYIFVLSYKATVRTGGIQYGQLNGQFGQIIPWGSLNEPSFGAGTLLYTCQVWRYPTCKVKEEVQPTTEGVGKENCIQALTRHPKCHILWTPNHGSRNVLSRLNNWVKAKPQILDYTLGEVNCFKSYEHAILSFKFRMSSIYPETGAVEGIFPSLYEGLYGSILTLPPHGACNEAVSGKWIWLFKKRPRR
ncbi:hypothetical protein PIB30_061023 [Stylosanthes scabra]|uniref:Uncharacterized protein n=1 Tax=Stylosanthes scabra TaxID=79078 RepID=A0ABU6VLQ7_9FABA|nr:hypothetical protein [Stylosanthes scabra]